MSYLTLLIYVLATALVASLLTLIVKNFISGEKKITEQIPRRYEIEDGQFDRSMSQLLGPPILGGNRIRRLENGVEIFPAMLAGIARAKETICFETYIYWCGETAEQFSIALSEKAGEGVKVHMLIDDLWVSVGSANFDNRSFRLNDEANLNVFDREFALQESAAFEKDKLLSREVTWEQWKRRPLLEKACDAAMGLLRSQL
ncbi:MAG: phospholipase D-like domain-containing protein [Opitutales bacterium]